MQDDKNTFSDIHEQVRPSAFLDYKLYLQSLYNLYRQGKERYSYKTFADDLGFGPSTVLHQIIKGYRPLTARNAEKISKYAQLKGVERKYFLTLVDYCNARAASKRELLFDKLLKFKNQVLPNEMDKRNLEYFSAWHHPIIRELCATSEFSSDPEKIADQLIPNLRPEQVRKSLALLEELELIKKNEAGEYEQTDKRVSTGSRIRGLALVSYHKQMMEHAIAALTKVKGKKRDISAMTFSIDEQTFHTIRTMIHEFQEKLFQVADSVEQGDRVYQVNIQLFPFTKDD